MIAWVGTFWINQDIFPVYMRTLFCYTSELHSQAGTYTCTYWLELNFSCGNMLLFSEKINITNFRKSYIVLIYFTSHPSSDNNIKIVCLLCIKKKITEVWSIYLDSSNQWYILWIGGNKVHTLNRNLLHQLLLIFHIKGN